jgi:uncharacterized protein (UPF0548 family)
VITNAGVRTYDAARAGRVPAVAVRSETVRSEPAKPAADVVRRLRDAEFTYAEVGATAGALPAGYHHLRRVVRVAAGFEEAAEALLRWQVHLRAGLTVAASAARTEPGTLVELGFGAGPVRVHAPCRVIYVVDEPHRRGFAYGTLPGHPERGEESFLVERQEDGTARFRITAFSRPARLSVKAAGPVARLVQRRITARYLAALAS